MKILASHLGVPAGRQRSSTEAYDRGNKFAAYRQLPALQEHVLVSLEARRIEVFRRNTSGH